MKTVVIAVLFGLFLAVGSFVMFRLGYERAVYSRPWYILEAPIEGRSVFDGQN